MDLNSYLYPDNNEKEVNAGNLIIADPLMKDPYFSRSVALILDNPADGGHLGLVMNKPAGVTLREIMPGWEKGGEIPIFCGGPVDLERMFLIHTLGDFFKDSHEVFDGVYVGADLDQIVDYIESGENTEGKLRFFLGYCGWSPGQLEEEIRSNSWAIQNNLDNRYLLEGYGPDYWRREVERLGKAYKNWLMVPRDPSYN